jgi:hypothetical protein
MISNHTASEAEVVTLADAAKHFRRLNADELVSHGDFVVNESRRFEPWVGLSGFRADAFVKPIYRKLARTLTRAKKPL